MSRKASPTAIGGFVLGAIVLVAVGIGFLGSGRLFSETVTYVLYFESSLKGLNIGAPVLFRGVRVGTVTDIVVHYHTADQRVDIPVYVELESRRVTRIGESRERPADIQGMIERGLRGQLVMQSFVTGLLSIELDFHPDTPLRLVRGEERYPELPTIPAPLEEFARTLQNLPFDEMVADLRRTVQGIDELVRSQELRKAIESLDKAVQDFGTLVRHVDEKLDPVVGSVSAASDEVRSTFKTAGERIVTLEKSLNDTLTVYRQLATDIIAQVDPFATRFLQTAESAQAALEQARKTLAAAETIAAPQSPLHDRLVTALEELSAAARAIRLLADSLERNPEALLRGKSGDN